MVCCGMLSKGIRHLCAMIGAMLSAAIDVGSNTLRMVIGEFHGHRLRRVLTDRAVTRLAGGLMSAGVLSDQAMKASLDAMKSFAERARHCGAGNIYAVGTSALRDAANSRAFIREVFEATGIEIEVISGFREAELTVRGVLGGMEGLRGPSLIIDIGGGSTEWILYRGPDAVTQPQTLCGTLPVGVVTLLERFIKTDPPSEEETASLTGELNTILAATQNEIKHHGEPVAGLLGTGGTITTLASIDLGLKEYDHERIHGHILPMRRLREMRASLLPLTIRQRCSINGLEPRRADLIIPGILLTITLMESFGFTELRVSDHGLLEGLLMERGQQNEDSL